MRIDWTCDPARTDDARAARVRGDRVRQGHAAVAQTRWRSIRESLLREFERNSQDNGYFLNQIARRYKDGDTANLAAISNVPDRIKMLTADELYEAAQDLSRYRPVREGDLDAGTVTTQ